MYTTYLLQSTKNNKSYVGRTKKPVKMRVSEHNYGSNKWTKENSPFVLKYFEEFFCERDAIHREQFFKTGQGKKLRKIILRYF